MDATGVPALVLERFPYSIIFTYDDMLADTRKRGYTVKFTGENRA